MKHSHTLKAVYAALFAALVFTGTQFLRIPLPFGYFNFGDCFVLLSAVILGGSYAILASAFGAALADVLSGYIVYAPATLLIKALMVVVMSIVSGSCGKKTKKKRIVFYSVGSVLAELVMTGGYFLCDTLLYGFTGAVASLPGNLLQSGAAVLASVAVMTVFEQSNLPKHIRLL